MTAIPYLQFFSCLTLAIVALTSFAVSSGRMHALLLSSAIFATLSGVVSFRSLAIEIFVAHYSGAIYEADAQAYRITGSYAWVYWVLAICLLIPAFSLFPAVRKNPAITITLAFSGTLPFLFSVCQIWPSP